MFENLWKFVCAHWIWFPGLIIGGFVYLNIGYLLLLAKLKVAKHHIRYNDHTYEHSLVLGFWTFIFFPQISFERLAGKEEALDYEEIPPVAEYLTHPEEHKEYPYFVISFWPMMLIWLSACILAEIMTRGICLISFSPFYLIWGITVGLMPLAIKFFTWPIRKFMPKLTKLSENQK